MCYAILRVKYIGEKSAQTIEVESESDMQQRIAELREKDQVVAIQVFPRKHDLILTKEWRTQLYEAPPKIREAA